MTRFLGGEELWGKLFTSLPPLSLVNPEGSFNLLRFPNLNSSFKFLEGKPRLGLLMIYSIKLTAATGSCGRKLVDWETSFLKQSFPAPITKVRTKSIDLSGGYKMPTPHLASSQRHLKAGGPVWTVRIKHIFRNPTYIF